MKDKKGKTAVGEKTAIEGTFQSRIDKTISPAKGQSIGGAVFGNGLDYAASLAKLTEAGSAITASESIGFMSDIYKDLMATNSAIAKRSRYADNLRKNIDITKENVRINNAQIMTAVSNETATAYRSYITTMQVMGGSAISAYSGTAGDLRLGLAAAATDGTIGLRILAGKNPSVLSGGLKKSQDQEKKADV